jgi:ATP-dependent Clp protease ATP-binding subunit ClpB
MLEKVRKRLSDKNITFEIDDAASKFIVNQAYDVVFGARPLSR